MDGGRTPLELRGLVRAVASQEHQNQHHGQWAADLRWLADYHNDNTAIELHWLNHSKSELALLGRNHTIDRLAIGYQQPAFSLKLGRQAINLASTYYFSPNDFFAPFTADTFYREYKAGVDAVRLDINLGTLSQLTLIGALTYDEARFNSERNRSVARLNTSVGLWQVAGLLGHVEQYNL